MIAPGGWLKRCSLGAMVAGAALLPALARAGADGAGARREKAEHDPIAIALPGCARTPYDGAALRDMLELELARRRLRVLTSASTSPVAAVRVELSSCDPDADHLIVLAADASGAFVLSRRVALLDVPYHTRARTLALLIAESLEARARRGEASEPSRSVVAEPGVAGPPVAEPPVEEATAMDPPALDTLTTDALEPLLHAAPELSTRLGLGFQIRSPLRSWATFWGAELRAVGPLWSGLSWTAEAALMSHASNTALGELHATWWSASLGVDVTRRGRLALAIGPRVSLAHVSAYGENRFGVQSLTQSEELALLGGRAGLGVTLGGAWQAMGWLDAQRALRGLVLTAGGEPSLLLDGWIASAGVGVGLALDEGRQR